MVKRGLILGGFLAFFCCFGVYNNVNAEGLGVSIDVSRATLQLTVPDSANLILSPSTSGAFGSVDINFSVATNNQTGYRVIMSVPQTEMQHSTISGANIPTLDTSISEVDFPLNKWGYKTTGDYNPIKLNNTDSSWIYKEPTNSHNHSLTIGAKVDSSVMAGTYSNTLTFTAVANPNAPEDTVIFHSNDSNALGTMSNQAVYQGTQNILNENLFTLENKKFIGWSTTSSGIGGLYYSDGGTITPELTGSSKTIDLYAIWSSDNHPDPVDYDDRNEEIIGTTLARAYEIYYTAKGWGMYVPDRNQLGEYTGTYSRATSGDDYLGIPARDLRFAMQDMVPEICESATNVGHQVSLVDLRDYKTYYATKMSDGKCWMTKNLDLDLSTSKTFTHDDTDLGWTTNNPSATWTPVASAVTKSAGQWTSDYNYPVSADGGDLIRYIYYKQFYGPNDQYVEYSNLSECEQAGGRGCDHYHVGNYYNFCAASASNYCENGAYDVPDSICPAGWTSPKYYTGPTFDHTDFAELFYAHHVIDALNTVEEYATGGFDIIREKPLYYISGSEYFVARGGWTESNVTMFLNSGNINATKWGRYSRGGPMSVRCRARN